MSNRNQSSVVFFFSTLFNWRSGASLLALCIALTAYTTQAKLANNTHAGQPTPEQRETAIEVISQLRLYHYRDVRLDNVFSSALLDKYIERLDPTRSYFLQADIDGFEQYRFTLDNDLNKGKLDAAYDIIATYRERVEERIRWSQEQLDNIRELKFDADEQVQIDRDEAPWIQSEAAMSELWRKRFKNEVLSLRLADKEVDEIEKTLTRRYKNQLNRLKQSNGDDTFQIFMDTVARSYDPHTEYFAPRRSENFNINMRLSLEGIGAVLQIKDEHTQVVRLIPGGPAEKSEQLAPRDKIIGVAQGDSGEIEDVVGWRLDEVVDKIRGPKDSIVRLQILPADEEDSSLAKEIRIVRNKIQLEEQAASKEIITIQRAGKEHKVGVIEVPTFYADFAALQAGDADYKSTTRDVKKLLEELKEEQVEGIIIDLRNNGGGSLNEANSMVGLFIESGATVQIRNSRNRVKVLSDSDSDVTYNGPLVVMINRLSASASEIFAGAIQDYERGIVVGGQTFGKGTVQSLLPVSAGQIKVTQAKFYRVSGDSTQHQGVLPDIFFPPAVDLEEFGESALDSALPWDTIRPVLHKKAAEITPYIDNLSEAHHLRSATNPDYQFRLNQIKYASELRNRKTLSLNEEFRRSERDERKAFQLKIENDRRKAKGLTEIADLEEIEEEEAPDPYLEESGHILIDYIRLKKQELASK